MRWVTFSLGLMASLVFACGSEEEPNFRADGTPTATPAIAPTATPTPGAGDHWHLMLGSHHLGGGEIMVHLEREPGVVLLTDRECVGGSGEDCVGGAVLYQGQFPAFASVDEDHAEDHLNPLLPGTPVEMEIVALSAGVRVQIGDRVLDQAGMRGLIGIVPFHTHGSWQLVLPYDVDPSQETFTITVRFLAPNSPYEQSMPHRLSLLVHTAYRGSDETHRSKSQVE